MKFIRWFLGRVILLLNFVFSPRGVKRSQEEQSKVNEQAKTHTLYPVSYTSPSPRDED